MGWVTVKHVYTLSDRLQAGLVVVLYCLLLVPVSTLYSCRIPTFEKGLFALINVCSQM